MPLLLSPADWNKIMEKMMGPRPNTEGFFRYHNCAKCQDGKVPCVNDDPRECDWPHARND